VALSAYLSLTAESQGRIEGGCTRKGLAGCLEVLGVYHRIVAPRDPASGIPTGRRDHKPFVVVTAVDQASPKLYLALTRNENLPVCTLKFYRPWPDGTERNHFTITLIDATISGIRFYLPNTRDVRLLKLETSQEVQFTYRRIEWHELTANVMASDDWLVSRLS
jgi:type VI secretion system secreted protein Hcp